MLTLSGEVADGLSAVEAGVSNVVVLSRVAGVIAEEAESREGEEHALCEAAEISHSALFFDIGETFSVAFIAFHPQRCARENGVRVVFGTLRVLQGNLEYVRVLLNAVLVEGEFPHDVNKGEIFEDIGVFLDELGVHILLELWWDYVSVSPPIHVLSWLNLVLIDILLDELGDVLVHHHRCQIRFIWVILCLRILILFWFK